MTTFRLTAQGPFSLAASIRFLEGFTPAGYTEAGGERLELAFPAEGSWITAGVRVHATATLTGLPGIGPFAAELVLLRGAGEPDRIPRHETRLGRAVALAYRLPASPFGADLQKLSQNWRPYRTWVTLLLRARLEDETGEIRGNT